VSISKTDLETTLLLKRTKQIELSPKVKVFLDAISRNSIKSKRSYSSGITLLQNFLNEKEQQLKYQGCNCETILQPLSENKVSIYELFDNFVSYILATKPGITPNSLSLYITALKSYFAYYDIDVIPSKFKRRVKMPKLYREDEQALDVSDIRKILLACNNRRLKAYLLVLVSGGMRAVEGLAIRLKDIDFSVSPTKIHIRKEYAKTKVARDIYISDEATQYLKHWIDWKYDNKERPRTPSSEDLVFTLHKGTNPNVIYIKICTEFQKLLVVAGLNERKENGIHKRRKITLHSFRRFVKTVISDQTNQDYSEWFLGHSKSPYYTKKEPDRREIYATKCMKYLIFLDYTTLEATGKNIETKLSEKEKEIQSLRKQQQERDDALTSLSDQVMKLMKEMEEMKKATIKA
jgi:integrase